MTDTKTKKVRTHKLTTDAKQNVKCFATYRLNRFLSAAKGLGRCSGKMFDYSESKMTPKQIADLIRSVADIAAKNIETGVQTVEVTGLQL